MESEPLSNSAAGIAKATPAPFLLEALLMFALSPVPAFPQTTSSLQSIPVFFSCLAQDQELANDFWDNNQGPREKVQETRQRLEPAVASSSWAVCVKRKQWVSKAFCRDVLDAYKAERGLDLRPVMAKHEDEMQQLKPMYDYFEAAFPQGGVERPNAPGCPE